MQLIQVAALDRISIAPGFKSYPPTVVLLQQFLRVLYVGVRNATAAREEIDLGQRRRRFRRDDACDGRQLNRYFVEYDYFIRANLNMIIKVRNDVNAPDSLCDIQGVVFLLFRNLALQNATKTGYRCRDFILSG